MYSLLLHGRRLVHLQKCLNFKLPLNPFQNVSAFSSAADVSLKGKTFTVSYLVRSLGFTTKLAESISRKVSFEDTCNADSVLSLLRSHGFNDSQISNMITDYPRLLVLDAEKSISPKLKFLKSREGVSTSELTEVLSKVPKIFGVKKDKATSVYYDFVKEIVVADKSSEFEKLRGSSLPLEGSKQENKMRNVSVLRELGMPQEMLFSLLISDYNVCCGKERFEESVKKVVGLGFNPRTTKFVKALQAVYQMSDKTIEEKLDVYKRLGFSVEDVWKTFKKWPYFLSFSGDKVENSMQTFMSLGFTRDEFVMMVVRVGTCIGLSEVLVRKKTEFLVKKMNWPLKELVSSPQVLNLSMEKRIVPRCNVIKALMSKGLLRTETPPVSSVLICTDDVFLKRYVKKHRDKELVAELMDIFTRREEKNKEKMSLLP